MSLGPLSSHMAQHIVLMNVIAPLLALGALRVFPRPDVPLLLLASTLQLGLIWFWHAPFMLPIAAGEPWLHAGMQLSLLVAALWFWSAVFAIGGSQRWKPILALLITSKLFCLLGVLLTFSPRLLYNGDFCGPAVCPPPLLLADQQLAGLLMLVACPATYLLAGLVIAAKWFRALERDSERQSISLTYA